MTPDVSRILNLLATAPARAGSTRVVAVDGPSGSGKTTLATALRAALADRAQLGGVPVASVVHLDDFYPGWDGLAAGVTRVLEWVLRPLAEGRPTGYRRFDWVHCQDAEWISLPVGTVHRTDGTPAPGSRRTGPVLVLEGVGAGSLLCAPYVSVLVWADAPETVRYARAMERDGAAYRPHWERWARQERHYFADHDPRGRADLIITDRPRMGA